MINFHVWSHIGKRYYQSASVFDSKCLKAKGQSKQKTNPIVENLAQKIEKILYSFGTRKGIISKNETT